MVRLRHIAGDNLLQLEKQFEIMSKKQGITYHQTLLRGDKFFIIYSIAGVFDEPTKKRKKAQKTITTQIIKE